MATSQKDPAKIQTGSGAGSRGWSPGFGSHGNSQTQDGEIVIVCVRQVSADQDPRQLLKEGLNMIEPCPLQD